MTTLNLYENVLLSAVNCYGNSRLETLDVVSSDNSEYPFKTDMSIYTGDNYTRIQAVRAYKQDDTEITSSFSSADRFAYFALSPHYIIYDYSTGYVCADYEENVPAIMSVRMEIPTNTFSYLPQIESKVVSVDSKVVSIDEAVSFHASFVPDTSGRQPTQQKNTTTTPETNMEVTPKVYSSSSGKSSGGCDAGMTIAALSIVVLACHGKFRRIFPVFILFMVTASCVYAGENISASDYTLPMQYEIYDIAGSYSTDFTFTQELAGKFAEILGIDASKIYPYSDIALSGTWNVTPPDLYNLARSGEYGGVILPITEKWTSNDRYVISCTFSNDVQPGETITVHGFEVDTSLRETVYNEGKTYMARFAALNDKYEQVSEVPENRRIYLSARHTSTPA